MCFPACLARVAAAAGLTMPVARVSLVTSPSEEWPREELRFDALTRAFFTARVRRRAVPTVAVGIGTVLGVLDRIDRVAAKHKHKKKKKKKKCKPLAQIKCGDTCCDAELETCGTCGGCCPEGQRTCCVGPGNKKAPCCESLANCCGANCCHPGTKCCNINGTLTCIAETECCPPDCNGGTCCHGECCSAGSQCCDGGGCCKAEDHCCRTQAPGNIHYCCSGTPRNLMCSSDGPNSQTCREA